MMYNVSDDVRKKVAAALAKYNIGWGGPFEDMLKRNQEIYLDEADVAIGAYIENLTIGDYLESNNIEINAVVKFLNMALEVLNIACDWGVSSAEIDGEEVSVYEVINNLELVIQDITRLAVAAGYMDLMNKAERLYDWLDSLPSEPVPDEVRVLIEKMVFEHTKLYAPRIEDSPWSAEDADRIQAWLDDMPTASEPDWSKALMPNYVRMALLDWAEALESHGLWSEFDSPVLDWLDDVPTAPEPDWSQAPENATHHAFTALGNGMWLMSLYGKTVEYRENRSWQWHNAILHSKSGLTLPLGIDWRTTLRQRPENDNA